MKIDKLSWSQEVSEKPLDKPIGYLEYEPKKDSTCLEIEISQMSAWQANKIINFIHQVQKEKDGKPGNLHETFEKYRGEKP